MYTRYKHHGKEVTVRTDLKGTHRQHCLCYDCENLKVGESDNCEIAQAVYTNCVEFDIVTPIFECPRFKQKHSG